MSQRLFRSPTPGAAAIAVLLVLAGTVASVLGAKALARSDADKGRLAFHLSSAEIASTAELAIQHEEDLVVTASAFVTGNPRASAADFDRWAESVSADAALSGAAGHRPRDARAGVADEGLRSAHGSRPAAAARADVEGAGRLRSATAGRSSLLLLRRGGSRAERQELSARGTGLLRLRSRAADDARQRPVELRAVPVQGRADARRGDARLTAAERCRTPLPHDGTRSGAGWGS